MAEVYLISSSILNFIEMFINAKDKNFIMKQSKHNSQSSTNEKVYKARLAERLFGPTETEMAERLSPAAFALWHKQFSRERIIIIGLLLLFCVIVIILPLLVL